MCLQNTEPYEMTEDIVAYKYAIRDNDGNLVSFGGLTKKHVEPYIYTDGVNTPMSDHGLYCFVEEADAHLMAKGLAVDFIKEKYNFKSTVVLKVIIPKGTPTQHGHQFESDSGEACGYGYLTQEMIIESTPIAEYTMGTMDDARIAMRLVLG